MPLRLFLLLIIKLIAKVLSTREWPQKTKPLFQFYSGKETIYREHHLQSKMSSRFVIFSPLPWILGHCSLIPYVFFLCVCVPMLKSFYIYQSVAKGRQMKYIHFKNSLWRDLMRSDTFWISFHGRQTLTQISVYCYTQ